jgi:protein transport protein SEC61 subunit gamma and related proteins
MAIKDLPTKTKSFYVKCARVWQVLKKPTREEFNATSKISAISILILGIVGFVISLIVTAI